MNQGLEIRGVSHRYDGDPILNQVDLVAESGGVLCLFGPSGSGKSTLLRLIAGLEDLQSGTIRVDGTTLSDGRRSLPPEKRPVGMVFQDYALFPHLDVTKNVMFGLRNEGQDARDAALELLDQVGMADFAHAMPHTLSGGQQQRVALVRALARKPRVMLLDEPFSGLDPQRRADVRALTLDLLRESGVVTVLVSHDPSEALSSADDLAVLVDGSVLQTGSADAVYRTPVSEEVGRMFGPLVVFEGATVRPEDLEVVADAAKSGEAMTVVERSLQGCTIQLTLERRDGSRVLVNDLSGTSWQTGQSVSVRIRRTSGA